MMFYPAFLDLRRRRVLVAGGGIVAQRKVETLLEAEADVTVSSPDATPVLQEMALAQRIDWRRRNFEEPDLEGAALVISATGDAEAQERIAAAARARGIPVNTVDQPRLCDFIVPAVVQRGDVVIAISTSGKSPALAAALRARIDGAIGKDVARAARLLGDIRSEVHARFADADRRKEVFEKIVASGILDWIGDCDDESALKRVRSIIDTLA